MDGVDRASCGTGRDAGGRPPCARPCHGRYAEQGEAGAGPIVPVHGWPDSWLSFSRVPGLLPARYHAYALDPRGFGASERPACCYAIDDLAAGA